MFVNPITNQQEYLELKYPNVDYFKFKSTNEYNNGDTDLISILDEILKRLDCTIEYNCGRSMMVAYHIYSITLSEYYFYLSRITNQFINIYLHELSNNSLSLHRYYKTKIDMNTEYLQINIIKKRILL